MADRDDQKLFNEFKVKINEYISSPMRTEKFREELLVRRVHDQLEIDFTSDESFMMIPEGWRVYFI